MSHFSIVKLVHHQLVIRLVLVLLSKSAVIIMENSLKIILSERGKELAVVSSHKYRFIRKPKDELLKWICYNKNCYASILTDANKTQVNAVKFFQMFNLLDVVSI